MGERTKKRVVVGTIVLIVVLTILLILNDPHVQGYLQSQERLKEGNIEKRYEIVVSSLTFELPEKPDSKKTFDMPNFLTPEATCYYDAGASVANYMENTSYDEFIWYGRPLKFRFYDGEYGVSVGTRDVSSAAFYNLGYTKYCGNTDGKLPIGVIDVVSYHNVELEKLKTGDLGAVADYKSAEDIVESYDNYVFFKTGEEALTFVKKIMSTDHPVTLGVKDWSEIPHFQTLFGYNETHVISPVVPETPKADWVELPEYYEEPIDDKHRDIIANEEFLEKIWGYWGHDFCWFDKTGPSLSKKEMFELNKKDALKAPQNIQKVIDGPPRYRKDLGDLLGDGLIAMASASRYLRNHGYDELADKYREIADTYREMGKRKRIELAKVKQLHQEAADLWKEVEL